MSPDNFEVFTVSTVADYIYSLIDENIPPLWIRGEISNLKIHQNGNVYLNLKDSSAKLSAIIMSNSPARNLAHLLKDGLEIMIYGNISYYKKEGYINVFIEKIEFLGEGILKQKFEELKKKLEAEGLFDKAHKKPIPEFPEWIGIITSPTGAAIRDILNVTKRRFSSVHIILFPVAVQGNNSAYEISRAIYLANKHFKDIIDVLIVGRGGGSIEDLWSFNEEIVARAVFDSEIPIISAVGHEIDYTITDYVADLRAPTPSAAAEQVVKDQREISIYVDQLSEKINNLFQNRMESVKKTLQFRGEDFLFGKMNELIRQNRLTLENLSIRLQMLTENFFNSVKNKFYSLNRNLNLLNPTAILQRGYTITYHSSEKKGEWQLAKSKSEISPSDEIKTIFCDGEIYSKISGS